jgi:hypothetical protein
MPDPTLVALADLKLAPARHLPHGHLIETASLQVVPA